MAAYQEPAHPKAMDLEHGVSAPDPKLSGPEGAPSNDFRDIEIQKRADMDEKHSLPITGDRTAGWYVRFFSRALCVFEPEVLVERSFNVGQASLRT